MLLSVNSIEIDCELVGLHLYRYRSEDVPAVVTLTRKPDAQAVSTVNGSLTGDVHLLEWFDKHEIPEDIQQRFVCEEITFYDLMNNLTKQDLIDLGLKVGPRSRIWAAITRERNMEHHSNNHSQAI